METELKETIAAQFSVAPDQIGHVKIELDILRKQGLLIDLDISGVGMFSRTASYLEMGWGDADVDARRQKMGRAQKFLIPDERIKALRSIESRMRQLLDSSSYNVTGFSPYRWLPVTAYERFSSEWQKLSHEFQLTKDIILDNLDLYKERLADEMHQVAEAAWKSITAVNEQQKYEWAIIDHKAYDHEQFIKMVMQSALAGFPTTSKIENELRADYRTALVYGDQDVAQDEAEAQRIRQVMQTEAALQKAAQQEAYLQASILQEQAAHENRMHRIEQQERELKLDAMFAAESEHARQQLNEIASPFAEVFQSLRRQIASDAKEILDSVKKNGFVRGKVAERGAGLLDLFEMLAVQDDRELHERLVNLRSAIGPIGKDRTNDDVRNTDEVNGLLEQIIELEHTAVQDLLAGPSRFSFIE